VTPSGAVLVGPEGLVCWRAQALAGLPERAIERALARI
jgi:hypothetical protein